MEAILLGLLKPLIAPVLGGLAVLMGIFFVRRGAQKSQAQADNNATLQRTVTSYQTREQVDESVAATAPQSPSTGVSNPATTPADAPVANNGVSVPAGSDRIVPVDNDRLRGQWTRD